MAGPSWEDVSCPLCSSGQSVEPWLQCSDRLREPRLLNYRVVRCAGCGLGILSPRPDAETIHNAHREEGYDPFLSLSQPTSLFDRAYAFARRFTLAWKRRLVRSLLPKGEAVLDVGCGTGEFLHAIRGDFEVSGVEPEQSASRWASERLSLNVVQGDIFAAPAISSGYALVTMFHALEHTPDPLAVIERACELLRPDGYALIALPNCNSLDARIYGPAWVPIDAPRHLWHFAPPQMKRLAEKTGLHLTASGMLPLDLFYNVLLSERHAARMRGGISPAILFRPAAAVISSLLWGAATGNHSGVYYLLRKPRKLQAPV